MNYVVRETSPLSDDRKVPFETLQEANDYAIEAWLNISEEDRDGCRMVVQSVPEGDDNGGRYDTHFDSDLHVHTLDLTPQDLESIALSLYENDFRHWQGEELIHYFKSTGIWRTLDFSPMGQDEFLQGIRRAMKEALKNDTA